MALRNTERYMGFPQVARDFQKVSLISQKVAQKLLKKQSKVTFCNESSLKVVWKNKNFFWYDAKICKLYNGQFREARVPTLQNTLYIRDDGVRA